MAAPRHFASSTIRLAELEIPVKLYSALSDDGGVSLKEIHSGCGQALERVRFCALHDELVEDEAVAKGYEVAPKKYLELTKDEVAAINDSGEPEVAIAGFVVLSQIPVLLYERSYYLAPHEGGDRGYALLVRILGKDVAAFGRSVVRGREHLAAVVAMKGRLVLRQVAHAERLRPIEEVPGALSTISNAEIRLGHVLMNRMTIDGFDVGAFEDGEKARVTALLKEKALGRAIPVAERLAKKAGTPILDLGDALERSLALPARQLRR